MNRKQIDPKNDAEKHKKNYQERNNHTTVDYGTPIDELRHPEKNGEFEARPQSGTFARKNTQQRTTGPIDRLNANPIKLSSPDHEQHPDKINRVPIAGGVRTKSEIESHKNGRRGGPISSPQTHVAVKPHKSETSQSIGARRQANPERVRDAVSVPNAGREAIDQQLMSDQIVGTSSSPKKRKSNSWGVEEK
ncbi:MAG TPA: hypothetical protein VGP35_13395 [Terriglobales bacterium]|jgi:hypothetical protein|nr:hypothetical protein [Terriglobales bacterium]